MQNRLTDAVEPNRLSPTQPTLRVAEHAMDGIRGSLGDARVDGYVERLQNDRIAWLAPYMLEPGYRLAIIVDRIPDATSDPEYVIAIATGGVVETARVRRLRPTELQARFLGVDELASLGRDDPASPPTVQSRRDKIVVWIIGLVGTTATLALVAWVLHPWVSVAVVVCTAVMAYGRAGPSRADPFARQTRLGMFREWAGVVAMFALLGIAFWAFVAIVLAHPRLG